MQIRGHGQLRGQKQKGWLWQRRNQLAFSHCIKWRRMTQSRKSPTIKSKEADEETFIGEFKANVQLRAKKLGWEKIPSILTHWHTLGTYSRLIDYCKLQASSASSVLIVCCSSEVVATERIIKRNFLLCHCHIQRSFFRPRVWTKDENSVGW